MNRLIWHSPFLFVLIFLENWKKLKIFGRRPFCLIDLHTLDDKLFEIVRNFVIDVILCDLLGHSIEKIFFIFTVQQRWVSKKNLVNKNAKCPYIGFAPINIVNEAFWRHVKRGSDTYIFEIVPDLDHNIPEKSCKSEVSYFCSAIMQKDVCHFEVTVHNMIFRKVAQTLKHISDDWYGLLFIKTTL